MRRIDWRGAGWRLARFALTFWVGAALLFVMAGIREVTSPTLAQFAKDQLVVLRFPPFYDVGIAAMGVTLVGLGLAASRRSKFAPLLFGGVAVALGLFAWDYLSVYQGLVAQVTPPGRPRTPDFNRLHEWSRWINTASWLLCLAASVCLNVVDPPRNGPSGPSAPRE